MQRGLLIALLLASVDTSFADERWLNEEDFHTSRIAALDERVSRLEDQLDKQELQTSRNIAETNAIAPGLEASFTHGVAYDNGWTLRPFDAQSTPFELKISFHNQFRYTGFASDHPFAINSAGRFVPTPSRNDFHINRGRLVFSGYAIDRQLEFYANIDYNTVADQQIQMLMAWIRHSFHPAFNVAYGQGKVPGSWEWQESDGLRMYDF